MFKGLYFKIILILVIFIITVMSVVGTVLMNSVQNYYINDFNEQMDKLFDKESELYKNLVGVLDNQEYWKLQADILYTYSIQMGIDDYRDFYILDMNGNFLDGTDVELGNSLQKTSRLLAAMNQKDGNTKSSSTDFSDYAIYLSNGSEASIVYIKDTQEEMQQLSWILFSIILQSLLIGLIISILLAIYLSKAIAAPVITLTKNAKLVASGEFSENIEVHSQDEIGVLTDTFNNMKDVLKSTLEEISSEREKLETVFSNLKDAVVAFKSNGSIIHINNKAKELFNKSYNEDFSFDEFTRLLDIKVVSINNKKFYTSEVDFKKEKETIEVHNILFNNKMLEVNFGKFRYVENTQIREGTIAVIHDVTARHELENSRREFVANVSHELRTPLTSIRGACETILLHPDMPMEVRENFLTMALNESDRMTHIVRDLLVLSRLDNNKTKWNISEFNINTVLLKLCEVMMVDAKNHQHNLLLVPDNKVPNINADVDRIEQIIVNVIANAIKYTPDGGKIEVLSSYEHPFVTVTIKDNGIGIPSEDLPHVFERFYRVEKSRTSDTGGTGLGLAIAKEIVEAHGGEISLTSEFEKGTSVFIKLPLKSIIVDEKK